MSKVFRCFVEKKPGFDVEAGHLMGELKGPLGVDSLTGVRVIRRYDVEGVERSVYDAARTTILSEPQVDGIWDEEMPQLPQEPHTIVAVEALPGQYDQRADSAAQCVQLLTQGERPRVLTARVICLKGELSQADVERIQHYLVNPVESRF